MFHPPTKILLADEAATTRFATCLGAGLGAGDCVLLSGSIGAGKSFFARALIRSRLGPATEVPSPTFTLVQTYPDDSGGPDIWHCDLYRLTSAGEVDELGLQDAFDTALCLIEWPDRLGPLTPPGALHLAFAAEQDHHSVAVTAPGRHSALVADCAAHV